MSQDFGRCVEESPVASRATDGSRESAYSVVLKNLDVADVVKVEYGALKGASLCEGCFDEYAQTIAWPALNTEDLRKTSQKGNKGRGEYL